MARQRGLERERLGLLVVLLRGQVFHLPDLGGVVGAAGGELLDVRGEEDAGDVFFVGVEVRDGEELGAVEGLDELPDEDIALLRCVLDGMSLKCLGGHGNIPHCWPRIVKSHRWLL